MDIKEIYKLYQQHPCITTDSRNCPKDSIFLALKGESFNGNQFAVQALEKGCANSHYALAESVERRFPGLAFGMHGYGREVFGRTV